MRFKIDENLPAEVAQKLREAGHDATTVLEEGLSGKADASIAAICQNEGRALVTLDTDFADIRSYPPEQCHGLIVLSLRRQDKPHVLSAIARLVPVLAEETLEKCLWIVSETRLRIRG